MRLLNHHGVLRKFDELDIVLTKVGHTTHDMLNTEESLTNLLNNAQIVNFHETLRSFKRT